MYKFGIKKLLPYQTEQDIGYRWYYNSHICEIREEEIPNFSKILKVSSISRGFNKSASVFAPWIEDNKRTITECFKYDMDPVVGMKLSRFIKDPVEFEEITSEIRENFIELKEIFIGVVAAGGTPPDINQLFF